MSIQSNKPLRCRSRPPVDRVMNAFQENQTLSREDKEFVRSKKRRLRDATMADLMRFMRILGIPSGG